MNEQIRERIAKVRRGEVPEGYIFSILGIVPSVWDKKKINAAVKLVVRPIVMNDDTTYQLITVKRAYGGVETRGWFHGKDIQVKLQYRIEKGDFLISKRQIVHGACGIAGENKDGAIVSNEYNVLSAKPGYDLDFFNFCMQLPRAKNLFFLKSIGVHIEKMLFDTAEWLQEKLYFPPSSEQKEIVKILIHCDKVIELKKQFIEQKRKRKNWLMRNLLDPDSGVRLPGFEGSKWSQRKLRNCGKWTGGGTPSKQNKKYWEAGTIKWISSQDVKCRAIQRTTYKITQSAVAESTTNVVPPYSIILVARSGILKRSFPVAHTTEEMAINQDIKAIIPFYDINYLFLQAWLERHEDEIITNYVKTGTTVQSLIFDQFQTMEILVPPLDEQAAIANILSTTDREIDLLEQELIQWQAKKKSLMQLLLTGLVRVSPSQEG